MRRVEIIDEEKARRTGAQVKQGQRGTVRGNPDRSYLTVTIEGGLKGTWSVPREGLKFIEEEQTMEQANKVYKPLVRTREGKLLSIWAGGIAGVCLEYKEGEITYSPEGRDGIWACETQVLAQSQLANRQLSRGILVVHEALALGNRCGEIKRDNIVSIFSADTRYPAILLGKEVWRERPREPVRPEPRFKVGDKVIIIREPHTIESISWRHLPNEEGHYHYLLSNELTYDEAQLSPAPPEPEWVNVTEECSFVPRLNLCGGWHLLVEILHNGDHVRLLGLNQIEPEGDNDYKVETDTETGAGTQWFRVWKRNS